METLSSPTQDHFLRVNKSKDSAYISLKDCSSFVVSKLSTTLTYLYADWTIKAKDL